VCSHPEQFIEFGTFKKGEVEVRLLSGDEVDVLFQNRNSVLAVEVKGSNAPESEYWRGLFQCVKYRAVLRAMRLAEGKYPNAHAVLLLHSRCLHHRCQRRLDLGQELLRCGHGQGNRPPRSGLLSY
jgi:hypothetical protein